MNKQRQHSAISALVNDSLSIVEKSASKYAQGAITDDEYADQLQYVVDSLISYIDVIRGPEYIEKKYSDNPHALKQTKKDVNKKVSSVLNKYGK